MKNKKGFSLIEILVVLTVFALVAVLSFQSIFLSLRGARKSDASVKVRETMDFAIGTIERHLRNADSITSPCNSSTLSTIAYLDANRQPATFSCTGGYVASGSAQLTTTGITISPCNFVCTTSSTGLPSVVTVNMTGTDTGTSGAEGAKVTISTKIYLRNY